MVKKQEFSEDFLLKFLFFSLGNGLSRIVSCMYGVVGGRLVKVINKPVRARGLASFRRWQAR